MEDRRSMRRFELKLPCVVCPLSRAENPPVQLMTRNISSGGAYIKIANPPPAGTRLALEILICRLSRADDCLGAGCVRLSGEVLRTDAFGMAVEFDDQYHIVQVDRHSRAQVWQISPGDPSGDTFAHPVGPSRYRRSNLGGTGRVTLTVTS